jgi:hypothetical protein
MDDLLLMWLKDKPELLSIWLKYKPVVVNLVLLVCICTALLAKAEKLKSFSLGLAAGIVIINIGQAVSILQSSYEKKLPGGND